MRSNNILGKNSAFKSVITDGIVDEDITIWKYISGDTKSTLDFTTEVIDGFKYVELTTPNEDCYILYKYGDNVEFIRVGSPIVVLMLHYIKHSDEVLDYTQYNYNSEVINSNILKSIGDNFYIAPTISVVESFYVVMGRILTLTLPSSYVSVCDTVNGTILLQRGNWQLVTIPIDGKVADDFVDKLETQEGVSGDSMIEVCSAYPGHINKFLSYIPGFTAKASEHNFSLQYTDEGNKEYAAFWVKCKDWTHTTEDIIFNW